MPAPLRDRRLYLTALLSAVLGAGGALITVGFIRLLEAVHGWLWEDLPGVFDVGPHAVAFVLPMGMIGGLLVGVCRRHLGEYPPSLAAALEGFRQDHAFDDRHLPQAVITSLAGLGFGAALGPEAVLIALVGGIGTWIAGQIQTGASGRRSLVYIGTAGTLGALFGSPGASAIPLTSEAVGERGRLWLVVPGVAAALAGVWVFDRLSSSGGYFSFEYPAYEFDVVDLAWAVPFTLIGAGLTFGFLALSHVLSVAGSRLDDRPIQQSLLGGLALGALASISGLVLFSGHRDIQTLIDDRTATVGFLVGIAALKLIATATLLGTHWKGGRFFPVMFAATAVGLASSDVVSGMAETPAIAVVMTAAVAALIAKPVAAAAVMAFIFPLAATPGVVIAGLLAGVLGQRAPTRFPVLAAESEPTPGTDRR